MQKQYLKPAIQMQSPKRKAHQVNSYQMRQGKDDI
jgi:hypothetical protein